MILLFFVQLIFITEVRSYENSPTILPRYDMLLNQFQHFAHRDYADLVDIVQNYTITLNNLSSPSPYSSNDPSTQCNEEFQEILRAASQRSEWAMKTIDAWGKPLPSGILKGNGIWPGNYDECLQDYYFLANKSFASQPFKTQYCSLKLSVGAGNTSAGIPLTIGLCVPASCNRSSVVSLIHYVFQKSTINEDNLLCSNEPRNGHQGLTGDAIAAIVIISLLVGVVLIGTLMDIHIHAKNRLEQKVDVGINRLYDYSNDDEVNVRLVRKEMYEPNAAVAFLAEFSALRSFHRIFTIEQKNDKGTFSFIHGIRVLSLFWVIIGHAFIFPLTFSENPVDVFMWTRNVAMQLISSAPFSVDTFFFLSGFLTAVLFLREVEKKQRISFGFMLSYYIHRYLRLTPTFLLVVLISISLTPYLGDGPIYPTQQGFEAPECRSTYWWTSIVYVGNLVKPELACLPIAWYLHNDMQFHLIAPLALIPFALNRKSLGFIVATLFTLVGIGSTAGLLIYYPNLQTSAGMGEFTPPAGRTYFNTIYVTPWCRLSAYFVGILTGFLVTNMRSRSRMSKVTIAIGNILAIILALACLFGIYPDAILVPGIDRTSFIIYQSLSRTVWSLCMGWLCFICITNQSKVANTILSWPVWAPLARLNYSTYLIHLTVIYYSFTTFRTPVYYEAHIVLNLFASSVFYSYLTGFAVNIFFETPFFILEKKSFKR